MSSQRRVLLAALLLAGITLIGIVGFMIIEGPPLIDAVYMTIISISTVGYGEVFPLSDTGRIFASVLIIGGIGSVFYTSIAVLELVFDNLGQRRRKQMDAEISKQRNHYIVCGFGRVGSRAWESISGDGLPCVVIERDPDRVETAREVGAMVVEGDATHNDTLSRAGIDVAASLIASVEDDAQNLVIVLSARALRPDLLVVARAHDAEAEEKFALAGADRVVAPQVVGGQRLAALALHRDLAEVFDFVHRGSTVEFRVEELEVKPDCRIDGIALRESRIRDETGAMVFAVEEDGGRLVVNPTADHVFTAGERIVVIGTQGQLDRFRSMVG